MNIVPWTPRTTGLKMADAAAHGFDAASVACGTTGPAPESACVSDPNESSPDGVAGLSEASTVHCAPVTLVIASAVVPTATPINASELGVLEEMAEVEAVVPVPVPDDVCVTCAGTCASNPLTS